jgi:hypothetical protein
MFTACYVELSYGLLLFALLIGNSQPMTSRIPDRGISLDAFANPKNNASRKPPQDVFPNPYFAAEAMMTTRHKKPEKCASSGFPSSLVYRPRASDTRRDEERQLALLVIVR